MPLVRLWDLASPELPELPLALNQDPTGRGSVLAGVALGGAGAGSGAGAGAGASEQPQVVSVPDRLVQFERYRQILAGGGLTGASASASASAAAGGAAGAGAGPPGSLSAAAALLAASSSVFRPPAARSSCAGARCLTTVLCDMSRLTALAFAGCDTRALQLMAAVGADEYHRPLICLWDISNLRGGGGGPGSARAGAGGRTPRGGSVSSSSSLVLLARQLSEFPINRLRFSPYANENCLLVSCGLGNIRFWRLKNKVRCLRGRE